MYGMHICTFSVGMLLPILVSHFIILLIWIHALLYVVFH